MPFQFLDSDYSGDRIEKGLERWGGICVATLIHLALIGVLSNQFIIIAASKPKTPLTVRFSLPPLPDPSLSSLESRSNPLASTPPRFDPAAATVSDPNALDALETVRRPSENQSETSENKPDSETRNSPSRIEPAPGGKPVLSPETKMKIAQEQQRLNRAKAEEEQSWNQLKNAVQRLEVQTKGRKFTLDSDGGNQGAIRTLDITGMPESVVQTVFQRYHIKIIHGAPASSPQPSFLNAAMTDDGVYRNAAAKGPQDVFVLSPMAIGVLSLLETQALQEQGYNPQTTRVREIRFGIVKNAKEDWDFGVTKLVTERIE